MKEDNSDRSVHLPEKSDTEAEFSRELERRIRAFEELEESEHRAGALRRIDYTVVLILGVLALVAMTAYMGVQ